MNKKCLVRGLFYSGALWAFLFFGLSKIVHAAPVVSGVSGATGNRVQITITGSGFGAKPTGKPFFWDDFESGNGVPSILGFTSSYSGSDSVSLTTSSCFGGGYCAKSTTGWRRTAVGAHLDIALGFGRSAKSYVYFRRRSTQTVFYNPSNQAQNTKTFRMWMDINGGTPDWFVGTQKDGQSILSWEFASPQVTGKNRFYVGGELSHPGSSWRSEEYFQKSNSSVGAQDGIISVRINSQSIGSASVQSDTANEPGVINYLVLEQVTANNASEQWCNSGDVWFDDIFVEVGTWSHAMICNASTLSASTSCVPQIPSVWSDTSIMATSNIDGMTAPFYLYVCDDSNTCNATGYLIR